MRFDGVAAAYQFQLLILLTAMLGERLRWMSLVFQRFPVLVQEPKLLAHLRHEPNSVNPH
jgi:hypothetical protein